MTDSIVFFDLSLLRWDVLKTSIPRVVMNGRPDRHCENFSSKNTFRIVLQFHSKTNTNFSTQLPRNVCKCAKISFILKLRMMLSVAYYNQKAWVPMITCIKCKPTVNGTIAECYCKHTYLFYSISYWFNFVCIVIRKLS